MVGIGGDMSTDQAMKKIGLTRASGGVKRRIILSVEAREKRGKSNFALSAPSPHAYFDFDTGLEGVLEKFSGTKEIYVGDYRRDKGKILNQADWQSQWVKFKSEYVNSLQEPTIRSITWDTATEVWESLRLAKFGRTAQVLPNQYGPANDEFREMIRVAFGSDKNVILLHKMKEEYVASKANPAIANWTGAYIRSGFKDAPYLVQMNMLLDKTPAGEFMARILDCRQNPIIAGLELYNEDITFQSIGTLVFPDTSKEDWL
jgi:hypothetical protein